MRRTALLAAAVALAAPGAMAHAAPKPVPGALTGCAYELLAQDPEDPARVRGVLYGAIAVADLPLSADPDTRPVDVTLTCSLQAAGSYHHSAPDVFTASGSGETVAVVEPVPFSVPQGNPDDGPIAVCGRAVVTDADGQTTTYYSHSQNSTWTTGDWGTCSGAGQCLALGSNCVWYLALLDEVVAPESHLCQALATLSPGVPGVVDIDGTGDVYVTGQFFWDCPPYA